MLISRNIIIKWTSKTKRHYEEKGYVFTKIGEEFEIATIDLPTGSGVEIQAQCDYCEELFTRSYRQYLQGRETVKKDCCGDRKCVMIKTKESNLLVYGVSNFNKLEEKKKRKPRVSSEKVLEYALNKGLEILNIEDYETDRSRLKVFCNNHPHGGVQETDFSNMKNAKGCCRYVSRYSKVKKEYLDGSIIVQEFIDRDLTPLFTAEDYLGGHHKMPYICNSHKDAGVQYRTRYRVLETPCPLCSKEERLAKSLQISLEILEDKNLKMVNPEDYTDMEQKLNFICVSHPDNIQTNSVIKIRDAENPCVYCRGEGSFSDISIRIRSSLTPWKEESERFGGYKCVLTGSKIYDVHHLYSFSDIVKNTIKELALDKKDELTEYDVSEIRSLVVKYHENQHGVCIHPDLHRLFHRLYGYGGNTPEQFEEFKQRYKNRDFDEILNERRIS